MQDGGKSASICAAKASAGGCAVLPIYCRGISYQMCPDFIMKKIHNKTLLTNIFLYSKLYIYKL